MAKICLILYPQTWNSITDITITDSPDNCETYYSIDDFLWVLCLTKFLGFTLMYRFLKLWNCNNFFLTNCSNSCHGNIFKNFILQQLFEFFLLIFFNENHFIFREGVFNLAGYLPDYCLKPELGPKMYIAYGSALYSNKGSTNLHIDMSDAVNYLVYVGFPSDGNAEENAKEVFKVHIL